MTRRLFIDEQAARSIYDFAPGLHSDDALLEKHIWSPISCRHTCWLYTGLVKCGDSGRTLPGTRLRNPFIVGAQS